MKLRRLGIKKSGRPDYALMAAAAILVVFGLAMLASASFSLGESRLGDASFYLKRQLIGAVAGLLGFLAVSRLNFRAYERFAGLFLFAALGALILLYTPWGVEAKGAVRSVALGPISFHPAEIAKLTFFIYLAAWLARAAKRQLAFWEGFVPFLLVCGAVAALLLFQRSTSAAVIITASALVMYFASGARLRYIAGALAAGGAILIAVIYATPYRWERIVNFLNPEEGALAGGYHLQQALIAIGSGGLTGVGYGQSASKIGYLPEVIGDSIFAIIAEELGFLGVSFLLILYAVLIFRVFIAAVRSRNKFGQLLLVGFGSLIALQTFVNIGAVSGLLPLTGTPLPFISYGRTALAVFMTMIGISVNISKYT